MAAPRIYQPEEPKTLVSWKEIAAFLNRAERTVKRWERERGLPVHRIPGGERGGVFAYPSELQSWLLHGEGALALESTLEGDEIEGDPSEAPSDPLNPPSIDEGHPILVLDHPKAEPLRRQAGSRRWIKWTGAAVAVSGLTVATIFAFGHYAGSTPARSSNLTSVSANSRHTPSHLAEQLYLEGRYQWSLRTAMSLTKSIDAYTQAIVEDPAYASAYAGLAESYDLLPEYGHVTRAEEFSRAKAAADRAIGLDPSLAAGHRAKAFAMFYGEWDVSGSDAEFQRALALDPNAVETHHWYATTLCSRLESIRSLTEIDEAVRLSPTNPAIVADAAFIHGFFHDNREVSIKTLRELAQTQPSLVKPSRYLAEFDLDDGNYLSYLEDKRAAATISQNPDEVALVTAATEGWARAGKKGMLEGILQAEQTAFLHGSGSGYELGRAYLRLGRPAEALPYFNAALKKNDFALMTLAFCNCIAGIRDNAGYASLLRQVHDRMHQPSSSQLNLAVATKPQTPPIVGQPQ